MSVAETSSTDQIDKAIERWGADFPNEDLTATSIAVRIHHLYILAQSDLQSVLRPFQIGPGEMDLLFCLMNCDPPHRLRPSDLSKGCMVTTGATTGRIDRLEQLGLVERTGSDGDRRSIQVQITSAGKERVHDIRKALLTISAFHKAIRNFPPDEQKTLETMLKKLTSSVDAW